MKTTLATLASASAVVLAAATAQADTIVVNLGGSPIVADGNNQFVDLNNDGASDIVLNDAGRFDDNSEVLGTQGGVGNPLFGFVTLRDLDPIVVPVDTSSYYTYGSILVDADGDLLSIGSGTSVDAGIDTALGGVWSGRGLAYNVLDDSLGGIPNVGDSIYVAAKMDAYEFLAEDGCNGCEFGAGDADYLGTFYAWFELTHGSLILSSFGYGASAGTAAFGVAAVTPSSVSPVPLPAGLPLLLVGLGAFGVMRSRKAATA